MITTEMKEIIGVCRKFASRKVGPYALEADLNGDREWLLSVWQESNDLGIVGLVIPEEFGGVGQNDSCCGLVLDTLSSECSGVASLLLHHYVACKTVLAGGEPGLSPFFKMLLNDGGHMPPIATVIFPSDMDERRLVLREEKGKLLLRGKSPLTGNATLARYFFAFVYEGSEEQDMTCVLIDRQSQGIPLGEEAGLPGLKVNPFAPVILEDVEISPDRIIGRRREAKAVYEQTLDAYHGFIAACAMGAARAAYSRALQYAIDRYQFGSMIIHHQEIQRMLGTMLAKLSVGTSSYIASLEREEWGMPHGTPKNRFSKAFCTDAALEIAIDAVQIHGGYGYMHDYGVEKILRDVKVLQLLGESNPVISIKTI
ncbi:MAG: acyl-CoA/acyl-ACP dehydrogenase [Desulfobacterota bacterium]|nr:acyl-CoA/acyl-ACP dehydrogenase [Thermodesulfobacteriota bacterium]